MEQIINIRENPEWFERAAVYYMLTWNKEYHYDTPCTVSNQIEMLIAAGFSSAEVVRQWKNSAIIIARK